jgi:hypothetical protein
MRSKLLKYTSLMLVSMGLLCSAAAQAEVAVFISNVPVQREVVGPPRGYQNCYLTPAGYFNGIWIGEHRICEYDNSPYGAAWVAGYWQCSRYHHGSCRRWYWQTSHWVRPGAVEYGIVWHNSPHYGPRNNPHYGPSNNGPRYQNGPGYAPQQSGPRYAPQNGPGYAPQGRPHYLDNQPQ